MEQIAAALELPREEVVLAMEAVVEPVSLFEPVYAEGNDAACMMDQLRDERCTEEGRVEHIALREAMAQLTARERHILTLRFAEGRTQMEVSAELGISQAQVSRLEKNAVATLRKKL